MAAHHQETPGANLPSHDRSDPGQPPTPARPVSLPPADVLARLALHTPLLRDALRLSRWSAPATPLSCDGLPYPTDARAAVDALGLWPHEAGSPTAERPGHAGRVRPADPGPGPGTDAETYDETHDETHADPGPGTDADSFALPWKTAVRLGLLETTADWARPAPGLDERVGDPEQVLRWWSDVFGASVQRARDDADDARLPGADADPEEGFCAVLAVLRFLYEAPDGFLVPFPVLLRSVLHTSGAATSPTPLHRRRVCDLVLRILRRLLPTGAVVLGMAADGGAEAADGDEDPRSCSGDGHRTVELTPLGRYGVRGVLVHEGVHAPVTGGLAAAGAAEFLDSLGALPPTEQFAEIRPWLDARSPAEALSEIAAVVGGHGHALRRWTGTKVLDATSSDIGPELRSLLLSDRPAVVSLAAIVLLTSRMLTSEDVERIMSRHGHWVVIDMIAAASERDPGDLPPFLSAHGAPDIEQLVLDDTDRLWDPEHPDTLPVLETIARHHPDPSTAARARETLRSRTVARPWTDPRSRNHRSPVRPRPGAPSGDAGTVAGPGGADGITDGCPDDAGPFRVRSWFGRRTRNPWRGHGKHRDTGQNHP